MSYCSLDDLRERLPLDLIAQLSNDADGITVEESVVAALCAAASELVDGYLRERVSLPLEPIPGLVRGLTADIAIYRLYARRPGAGVDPPKAVTLGYATALETLRLIQAGKVSLGSEAGDTARASEILVNLRQRIFSDKALERLL